MPVARRFASPTAVLVIVPMLVIAAGATVMLVGRTATRDASDSLARRQLASQAADVQHDVAFALDQAEPLLARLRVLADPTMPIDELALRLHELVVGRPGVANVSIGFPNGNLRGTFVQNGAIMVQESIVGAHGTERTNYAIANGLVQPAGAQTTDYDVRKRPHYTLATAAHARIWTPPRVYFTSHTTGVTCAEPVYAIDGSLVAVTTVDFDVGALSQFIVRAPLEGARTVVFAGDGTILAYPGVPLPDAATKQNRLLRHTDFGDPALSALLAALGDTPGGEQRFLALHATDGDYLASVAPIGGKRAAIAAPLDWYLATLVPDSVLLGPTHRLEKQSLVASGGALAMALGVSLMFAWNLVRMRRAVGAAREAARDAAARVSDLGSYRLVARLGAGGMGEVWRAEHRLLARAAAIKLVRPEALRDPQHAPRVRERFRREAQSLATMRSRHTIALYDYGVADDGTFYYVMELLDGLDLDKLVRHHGPQSAARTIAILVQACQSLAEAHAADLLHRDIKPANIFLARAADEVDIVKVLDFGIVQSLVEPPVDPLEMISLPRVHRPSGRLTRAGAMVGTPGYLAPEQAWGSQLDPRTDLYSLGCVAWWLLTGDEVYPRPDEETSIRSHMADPVPALRPRVHGWLPRELEELVTACLAKEPEERPASAAVLGAALRAIAIPAEHAWTPASAQAWWYEHRVPEDGSFDPTRHLPPAPPRTAAPPPGGQRLMVSRDEDAR